jgi:hypothetical protein
VFVAARAAPDEVLAGTRLEPTERGVLRRLEIEMLAPDRPGDTEHLDVRFAGELRR